jgi:diamine N-acetyltransferase
MSISPGAAWRLMTGVHEVAADLGGTTLWLSVWERNGRARAFYKKCGFEDVGTGDFWVGGDRQTDRILVAPVATGQSSTRSRPSC